jgi:broad-specificity NMP kinase/DNA-directed RNA polymerase subunit RPC12/RpoP
MDKSSLLQEFKEALAQEIEHIKKTGGDSKFILRDGSLVNDYGGKFIYEFITDVPIEIDDDTPVNIKYGDKSINGSIISINGLKVLVNLDENIGNKIPEIIIIVSPYYLLEILQERIDDINSKKISFNDDIAMKVFGFSESNTSEDYNFITQFSKINLPISNEQKNVLAKCLGSEVTFIWGPPGTGKTTVLSYLANELLLRNYNILITSHTNIAIDNALEKIAKILKEGKDRSYFNGEILRIGNPTDKNLFEAYPELNIDYWVEKRSQELTERLKKLEEILIKETDQLNKFKSIIEIFGYLEENEKKIDSIKSNIKRTKQNLLHIRDNISKLKEKIKDTKNKLEKAKNADLLSRLLKGLNQKKLEKLLVELSSSFKKEKTRLLQLRLELKDQIKNLHVFENERNTFYNKLLELFNNKNILKKEEILREIENRQSVIKGLNKQIEDIKVAIQQIEHDCISNAKLIGTTITRGYLNPDIYNKKFDVVIVDEASMAPPPSLFFNCGLAKSKVIIIGDFRQLSPIATANHDLVNKWLKRNIFEIAGIQQKIDEGIEGKKLVVLKKQRRMPKEIAKLVKAVIYNGILETETKPHNEAQREIEVITKSPFSGEKVILCDTSEFNPWCTKSPILNSKFNVYNSLLAVYLAEQASVNGVENVVILTPYRAQNRLIFKLLSDMSLERNILASSVHRFQGKECDLVIFDLVEGPFEEIKWLGGGFNTEAMRLINVAITRTKAKIIFVANLQYLKKKLKDNSILKKIIENVEKNYCVISSQTFFKFEKASPQKNKFSRLTIDKTLSQFYDQASFYEAFKKDLLIAEDEVIIYSPFITKSRLVYFEAVFRELSNKGIEIFIITKPFKEQKLSQDFANELVDELKKLNINIIHKPLCHEKLAVIDNKIVWFGSLNILSHKNTSELMIRFTTTENRFSQEILKLCDINPKKIIENKNINEKITKLNKESLGFCSKGHPLVIRQGSYGIFLSCREFPRCKEKKQPSLDIIAKIFGERYLYCENCGSKLVIKFNRKRKRQFLSCPRYPQCIFTREI